MSLALITVNALIPDEADRVVVAESAMPHLERWMAENGYTKTEVTE